MKRDIVFLENEINTVQESIKIMPLEDQLSQEAETVNEENNSEDIEDLSYKTLQEANKESNEDLSYKTQSESEYEPWTNDSSLSSDDNTQAYKLERPLRKRKQTSFYKCNFVHVYGQYQESKWLVDSGADEHMCCDRSLFTHFANHSQKMVTVGKRRGN
ncbi:unnamed protein product, partial [Brenthis ino]